MIVQVNIKGKRAQTALELAVFGAILIFVLGSIIRAAATRGQQQHTILKATRMALSESHRDTETKYHARRNAATVLVFEDRLTAASAKYGAVDRIPFMAQGSGTHSANLFMPVEYKDDDDLPVFDMFINGKHFVFTAAKFKTVTLAKSCQNDPACPADCTVSVLGNCSANSLYYSRGKDVPSDIPGTADFWEDNCLSVSATTRQTVLCEGASPCPAACTLGCGPGTGTAIDETVVDGANVGCAKLYTIIDNHPAIDNWCDGSSTCPQQDCLTSPGKGCNLSLNQRFDLDREDLDGIPGDALVPVSQRGMFSWQWFLVMGVEEQSIEKGRTYDVYDLIGDPTFFDVTFDGQLTMAEGIILPGGDVDSKNVFVDVDYDLKLERIMPNSDDGKKPNKIGDGGVITELAVMDYQDGDIDFTYDDRDRLNKVPMFGFTKDVNIYTYVRGSGPEGGTFFQINEGMLYDGNQFIRTLSKKDSIDMIERVFQLSNNTGAFCSGGFRQPSANGVSNPVEVCGDCFSPANISKTCMDEDYNIIFIRSRIQDLHGRGWSTDTSQDPHIDFKTQ